ncbi:MAG: hypothetical protein GY842_15530, partial [bacterium]|nr:hypothetical protein [bacterium]
MTASTEHSAVEHRISDGLARARQRVHRAVLRGRAVVAMERGFRGLAVVALVYAALSVICLLLGYTAPLGWGTYVVLLVAALLVPSACTMYAALRALPSVVEAAERLDLATADHNRIATALCLAARGARDPFTEAAITDGMSCLQRLQDEHPRLDPVRWCRARTTQPLGVALVATLASVACSMV